MTVDDILAAARECLETPFRHQGRIVGIGLDCAGVVVHVCRRLGLDIADVEGYGRTPTERTLERALASQPTLCRVHDHSERRPADVLLLRFARDPQHVAILGHGTIIHAYELAGKCCEHRLSSFWSARIVAVYRFRGLAS
jgi:cell wall-associated NlpC family hydrolase